MKPYSSIHLREYKTVMAYMPFDVQLEQKFQKEKKIWSSSKWIVMKKKYNCSLHITIAAKSKDA